MQPFHITQHMTSMDPKPPSLCQVYFKTVYQLQTSCFSSSFSFFALLSPPATSSHSSSYISTGSSLTGFSDMLSWVLYTEEKNNVQCSCHVVGAFLYIFYTSWNLCKEKPTVFFLFFFFFFYSIHTFIQVKHRDSTGAKTSRVASGLHRFRGH